MKPNVALLRGINVGGNRKLPMAELRTLAETLGLEAVRTYVASGNLVFRATGGAAALEALLEEAIKQSFGFSVDVMVRSKAQWSAYRKSLPFVDEVREKPNYAMLCIGKRPATDADVEALRARASDNERVERRDDAIWIWFGDGAGRSKIGTMPGKSIWTTRNWRTVVALDEMLRD
jgi:uncharacterized protein (DUF1697 family)